MELKVEYLPKSELKPYANNAKVHTAEQINAIKNSIAKFGFNDPIAVWKDNEIIEGHGRLLAAMEMENIDTVPVIRLDHLTDKERKAYIIAHNKRTLNTTFENDLLGEELKSIIDEIDMTDFGFGNFEIEVLTQDFEPEEFDKEMMQEYAEKEQDYLAKKRVIITYTDDEAETLKKILGVSEINKVVYDINELTQEEE